ncbi:uncharacterized protein KY384_000434 [Bacidia gigantensis]|uniref:uncharacterized protein n=1 Tax=Bacidia gigantensis TaxID=2732470 RepID=UPI001D045EB2|nr:uncharacterized protein KY384_000434 [Bacidia gigantensis]KAG8525674.1 hypothetical protein KY384_000434 [Bacidia gigantensis]
MHLTTTLALLALTLPTTLSHPHLHIHRKSVDYSNPALYKDVDWSKVSYSGSNPAPAQAAAAPAQASPQQSQPAAQAAAPQTEQKSTQQASTNTAPATSTAAGGSKRGLAYNWETASLDMFEPYAGKTLSWAWNWDSTPFRLPTGFAYVPCLRTTHADETAHWAANAASAIKAGSTYILGFNEPDIADQANLPPGAAVDAWNTYLQPLKSGNVQLGSPQVSNGVGTNPATGQAYGLDWLSSFLGKCSGCSIDFIIVHWYGCTDGCSVDTDVSSFKDFVGKAVALAAGKKVWITEFARVAGASGADDFMAKTLPWLDAQGGVERPGAGGTGWPDGYGIGVFLMLEESVDM